MRSLHEKQIHSANVHSYSPGINRATDRLLTALESSRNEDGYVEDIYPHVINWTMEGGYLHLCGYLCYYTLCAYAQQCNACSLSLNASSVVCYVQRAVYKWSNPCFSKIRRGVPWSRNISAELHTLYARLQQYQLCASVSVSDFRFSCYDSYAVIYTFICSGWNRRLSLRDYTQAR